jgi:proteasome lid subunit RPN8/RPN11
VPILKYINLHISTDVSTVERAPLFGELTADEAVVERVVVTPNKLQSTVRFEIRPETAVRAFKEAEDQGLDFVGFFHSHPTPANPSKIDLKCMKLWGDAVWLIMSSNDCKLAAFKMEDDELKEVTIRSG